MTKTQTFTGRFLLGGISWKPSKLDGQGEVKDQAKLVAELECLERLSAFVEFVAEADGERCRLEVATTEDLGLDEERFFGEGLVKGAKWSQGSRKAIELQFEFLFDDHARALQYFGLRLAMDRASIFEANVSVALLQPKLAFDEGEE